MPRSTSHQVGPFFPGPCTSLEHAFEGLLDISCRAIWQTRDDRTCRKDLRIGGEHSRAALSVAYGAGLRVSEAVALKPSDINSKRMVIRIEQGKGRKDRYAMLSPYLLELLRAWWKVARPPGLAIPGRER